MLAVGVFSFFAGAALIAVVVVIVNALPAASFGLPEPAPEPAGDPLPVVEPAPEPAGGPLVVELEPVYPNGAVGALVRLELEPDGDALAVNPPPAGSQLRVRLAHRAGLYAGESLAVERPSEPVPAFLKAGR